MLLNFLQVNANTLGVIGVILVLLAYVLLQIDKMKAAWVSYSLFNAVGSGLILISLYFYWNLASGIIEIAWFIISLYGLAKSIYKHYRHRLKLQHKT
jgi:membrane-bound ClpP family serine protease